MATPLDDRPSTKHRWTCPFPLLCVTKRLYGKPSATLQETGQRLLCLALQKDTEQETSQLLTHMQCKSKFSKLDTHLKNSATSKIPFNPDLLSLPQHHHVYIPHRQQLILGSYTKPQSCPPTSPQGIPHQCNPNLHSFLPPQGQKLLAMDGNIQSTCIYWTPSSQGPSMLLSTSTVEERNRVLCEGVYQYVSQNFGTHWKACT